MARPLGLFRSTALVATLVFSQGELCLQALEPARADVTYAWTKDRRLVAYRRPDARSYPWKNGIHLGYPPKGCTAEAWYRFDEIFAQAGRTYGIDPAFLKAVAWIESRFQVSARSSAGAQGVAQIMPGTAPKIGVTDPFDPVEAIWGEAAYFRRVADRFRTQNMLILAASYNAGPDAVDRAVRQAKGSPSEEDLWAVVPNFSETRGHVHRSIWTWDCIHRGLRAWSLPPLPQDSS